MITNRHKLLAHSLRRMTEAGYLNDFRYADNRWKIYGMTYLDLSTREAEIFVQGCKHILFKGPHSVAHLETTHD